MAINPIVGIYKVVWPFIARLGIPVVQIDNYAYAFGNMAQCHHKHIIDLNIYSMYKIYPSVQPSIYQSIYVFICMCIYIYTYVVIVYTYLAIIYWSKFNSWIIQVPGFSTMFLLDVSLSTAGERVIFNPPSVSGVSRRVVGCWIVYTPEI